MPQSLYLLDFFCWLSFFCFSENAIVRRGSQGIQRAKAIARPPITPAILPTSLLAAPVNCIGRLGLGPPGEVLFEAGTVVTTAGPVAAGVVADVYAVAGVVNGVEPAGDVIAPSVVVV